MRRRKNIIISAITCMFSICLMMFGVYAASNPNVSINGQVSYTARDASVLVQGKMYGADGYESVDYKIVTDPTSPTTDDVLTNSVSQYVDYTSADQNKTTLATWSLGDQLKFYEDQNGIRKVNVCLKFTNLSNYPVMATAVFENKTATNVKTTQSPTDGKMAMTTIGSVGSDCEMSFVFEVEDDSKNANIDFKLVVTIEKTVLQNYTATFSSGTKQFSNQSNAKSYDISETTVLEEAPELYFEENGANRRVALWYDNQECQGEPIKFPYVLTSNKTFYSVWEVNRRVFDFYDYGNDIQVMFDGYKVFRAKSLVSFATVFTALETYSDSVTIEGNDYLVIHQENILGFQAYNNFLCNKTNNLFYIIPGYTLEELGAKIANEQYEEIFKKMVGGYSIDFGGDEILEVYFVTTKSTSEINVQVLNEGKDVASQVGYNIISQVNNLPKYTATLHSGTEHKFVTGKDNENNTYITVETVTNEIAIFSKIVGDSVHSNIENNIRSGNELYVAEWYDNAELSGEPISLPYTLTKNTDFYAKWEYNTKYYKVANDAKNVEIWVKGKKVLKIKDMALSDSDNSSMDTIGELKTTTGDTLGVILNFKVSDKIEYADTNFKLIQVFLFVVDFYHNDWNKIDFSKVTSEEQIYPGIDTGFFTVDRGDHMEIQLNRGTGYGFKSDDLIVYVDGKEAEFVWENRVQD